jgi:hypothetical protein
MKRTEPDQIVAALAELHVLSDKARDVDALADFAKGPLIVFHSNDIPENGSSSVPPRIPSRLE